MTSCYAVIPNNISLKTSVQVMFYDTDCGGVVHNLAYLRWIEECRTKLATKIGMDYLTLTKDNKFTVVVRHEIDYIFPAVLADQIETTGWLEAVDRASLWFRFEVRRPSDGKLCVRARQRLALVQMPEARPCRLPAEWKNLIPPNHTAS